MSGGSLLEARSAKAVEAASAAENPEDIGAADLMVLSSMVPSSSGLGYLVLIQKITGSNPVGTARQKYPQYVGIFGN
jgi:hypothetical protein